MKYADWLKVVRSRCWTLAELRCDVRPSEGLLEFMDQVGLDRWERFVRRMESEAR